MADERYARIQKILSEPLPKALTPRIEMLSLLEFLWGRILLLEDMSVLKDNGINIPKKLKRL